MFNQTPIFKNFINLIEIATSVQIELESVLKSLWLTDATVYVQRSGSSASMVLALWQMVLQVNMLIINSSCVETSVKLQQGKVGALPVHWTRVPAEACQLGCSVLTLQEEWTTASLQTLGMRLPSWALFGSCKCEDGFSSVVCHSVRSAPMVWLRTSLHTCASVHKC